MRIGIERPVFRLNLNTTMPKHMASTTRYIGKAKYIVLITCRIAHLSVVGVSVDACSV